MPLEEILTDVAFKIKKYVDNKLIPLVRPIIKRPYIGGVIGFSSGYLGVMMHEVYSIGYKYDLSDLIYPLLSGFFGWFGTYTINVYLTQSEQKQDELLMAKEEAETSNKEKGEILATIAHELRNPTSNIIVLAELILVKDYSPSFREDVDLIKRISEYNLSLLNSYMDLSRLDSKTIELREKPFNLYDSLGDIIYMLKPKAEDKGIDFELNYDCSFPKSFIGDGDRIKQIIINLAGNGIKFTYEGKVSINVNGHLKDDIIYSEISVKDTGVGISEKNLNNIFDRYFQDINGKSNAIRGDGLGLQISKQLTSFLGGNIRVESEIGKGSIFCVNIPLKLD